MAYVVMFKATRGPNKGAWVYNNSHKEREPAEEWVTWARGFWPATEWDLLVHGERFEWIGWWL